MLVLDIPQRSPDDFAYVEVPIYHRVHLSLAADIPVYACLMAGMNQPHLPELVISPFEFTKWDKVWRLNLSFKDRPGLLHEVCQMLGWNEVDILAAESSTVEEQNLFYLEMILHVEDEHQVPFIEWSLSARFCEDIKLLPSGKPRLRMHRLEQLFHAKRAYEKQRHRQVTFHPVNSQLQAEWRQEKSAAEQPTILLPSRTFRFHLTDPMREILNANVKEEVGKGREGYYLRLSDTKDRFLRVLFFKINDPVIHCRIEFELRTGAMAKITDAVRKKGFNILTSYLAPSDIQGQSRLEVVARCNALAGRSAQEIKDHLEAALCECSSTANLGLHIGYPSNFGRVWEKQPIKSQPIKPFGTATPGNAEVSSSSREQLLTDLKAHHTNLLTKLSRGSQDFTERLDHKYAFASRLIEQYDQSFGPHAGHTKSLFVSCHYKGNQLQLIEKKASARGVRVVTGRDLLRESTITAGLLNHINSCSHFLGVWSREGAQACGDQYWPSPWLLWEFGVAEAFGLEWRLLISNDIASQAWQKVASHTQHLFFDFDFETKVDEMLEVLLSKPARRLPFVKRAAAT